MAVLMVKPPFGPSQMADQHMRKQIHPKPARAAGSTYKHQGQLDR